MQARVLLVVGTVLISTVFLSFKELSSTAPLVRVVWRLQAAMAGLLPIFFMGSLRQVLCAANILRESIEIFAAGLGYAVYNIGASIAVSKTSMLHATVLCQSAPLFLFVAASLRGRGVSCRQRWGFAITVGGMMVFAFHSFANEGTSVFGDMSGLMVSAHVHLRFSERHVAPAQVLLYAGRRWFRFVFQGKCCCPH